MSNSVLAQQPHVTPASQNARNHAYDASSSFCGGDNLLLYNAQTGAGLSGKIKADGFTLVKSYPAGAFRAGWTDVAGVDGFTSLLFYDNRTGEGAVGDLEHGSFATTQTYNSFARGWTNIVYGGLSSGHALPVFYNASTGSGALGFAPTVRVYQNGAFAPGWTHIVWDGNNLLFYNTNTGSGAVVVNVPVSLGGSGPVGVKTTKTFAAGDFSKGWTHLAVIGGKILFYNYATGSAAIGRLIPATMNGANNFVTDNTYPANFLAPHWTHMVSIGNNLLLFYNSATGDASIVEMGSTATLPSAGSQLRTVTALPKGTFAPGFTHVACSQDPVPIH